MTDLACPRCGDDLSEYHEDDLVWRTGDDRPYCSGECVVRAWRDSQKPYPPHDDWLVQMQLENGQWSGSPYSDEAKARTRLAERRKESPDRRWRLVRMTTTYSIVESDGEHVGGNAENCAACIGTNPPYPFICPGPGDAP